LLEKAVRGCGLGDKVLFVGFQADPAAWYPAMDAFVLPSLTEGTPMALLEAMANGLPVIASSVGGVPAILSNGENGILVPQADPTGLVEAMQAVAGSRELRMKLSDGAILSVRENHDVNSWIRKVCEVYRTMLQENRGSR
jgi:glycosyltransferase involved in cell wall biosynthesis